MTIWDKIKYQFNKNDSPIRKLIILNIAVFIAVALFKMVANLYQADDQAGVVLNYLNLSPRVGEIISRPWTIITHMFMHAGLMHILGNMLLLYFMGRIFEDFVSKKTVYAVYFGGGLLGAFISVLFTNIFPVLSGTLNSGYMLGASACVTSIVAAAAILVPNYEVYLFGAFRLKIKWIANYVIALDILLFTEGNQ
ncbi:MAG: membrane associated rhomboid family serine protease, partial [Bacteroidia bacterium]